MSAKVAVAAAVNDQAVLDLCLARSDDIKDGLADLRTYRGYRSAGAAYNAALIEADADYVVLAHQDVYLPPGSIARLAETLDKLSRSDPNWAVAGVIGLDGAGDVRGQTWSSGLNGLTGAPLTAPAQVELLDELLLVVRAASGIRFDEALPGFHLYGTDIVQSAKARGLTSYAVPLLVIHHSRSVTSLPADYRRAYRYVARKWRKLLPMRTLVCPLSSNPAVLWWNDLRIRKHHRFRTTRVEPKGDPVDIARRLGGRS
ncbi:MAG TPA: hypothetical protein VFN88_04175 [Caulobacteraceae bacterium]|nr:hypothetical protein [Caulobacteraceae bacterium]